jgi:hypothetical protein
LDSREGLGSLVVLVRLLVAVALVLSAIIRRQALPLVPVVMAQLIRGRRVPRSLMPLVVAVAVMRGELLALVERVAVALAQFLVTGRPELPTREGALVVVVRLRQTVHLAAQALSSYE